MPITGVERSFYTLSGAVTPPYYTEAALYLLTPFFQAGDLAILSQIAQLTPSALLVGLLLAIWRGELVTKREAERMRSEAVVLLEAIAVERERERAAFQARFEIMEKSYLARLDEKDRHQTDSDKQVQVLIKLVQEGTLMLGQAAALVGNNQKTT